MNKRVFVIVLIVLTSVVLSWVNGFFYRFNIITAKCDIANNNLYYVHVGDLIVYPIEMNKVSKKYGFKNISYGCTVSEFELNGIEDYNDELIEFLNIKNGLDWKNKYNKDLDSLINLYK